jgi:hypothetical protein
MSLNSFTPGFVYPDGSIQGIRPDQIWQAGKIYIPTEELRKAKAAGWEPEPEQKPAHGLVLVSRGSGPCHAFEPPPSKTEPVVVPVERVLRVDLDPGMGQPTSVLVNGKRYVLEEEPPRALAAFMGHELPAKAETSHHFTATRPGRAFLPRRCSGETVDSLGTCYACGARKTEACKDNL